MTQLVADARAQRETTAAPASALSDLARRKLEAYTQIDHDFMVCFHYLQEVHGLRRFARFPVAATVRYLHALLTCERKDLLLSVPDNGQRYEGVRCLDLLQLWQEGQTAEVVAFIHHKLDGQPFAELTAAIEKAEHEGAAAANRRATLHIGRAVLLNRYFTQGAALDAIFALDARRLRSAVRAACKRLGYTQDEIERLRVEMRSDLYTYAPHPALVQQNMVLMNHIGALLMGGDPARRAVEPALPLTPPAAILIPREATQLSLNWRPWS